MTLLLKKDFLFQLMLRSSVLEMTSIIGNSGRVLTKELKEMKVQDTMGTKYDYCFLKGIDGLENLALI